MKDTNNMSNRKTEKNLCTRAVDRQLEVRNEFKNKTFTAADIEN